MLSDGLPCTRHSSWSRKRGVTLLPFHAPGPRALQMDTSQAQAVHRGLSPLTSMVSSLSCTSVAPSGCSTRRVWVTRFMTPWYTSSRVKKKSYCRHRQGTGVSPCWHGTELHRCVSTPLSQACS